jgi:hypothetical protein
MNFVGAAFQPRFIAGFFGGLIAAESHYPTIGREYVAKRLSKSMCQL